MWRTATPEGCWYTTTSTPRRHRLITAPSYPVADRTAQRVEFWLGDQQSGWRTAGFEAAAERQQRYAAAEARRLLYVACTRARDHLLVTSTGPASEFLDDLKG